MFEWLKPKDSGAKSPTTKDKAALIKEAMANARTARETIGEETLDRLVELMNKKKMAQQNIMQNPTSPADQAKKILREMDKGLLSDHLKDLMQSERTPPTKQ